MLHRRQAPGRDLHKHVSLAPARSNTNLLSNPQSAPAPSPLQDRAQARNATSRAPHLSLIPLSLPPAPSNKASATEQPAQRTAKQALQSKQHSNRSSPPTPQTANGHRRSRAEKPRPPVHHRCQVFRFQAKRRPSRPQRAFKGARRAASQDTENPPISCATICPAPSRDHPSTRPVYESAMLDYA